MSGSCVVPLLTLGSWARQPSCAVPTSLIFPAGFSMLMHQDPVDLVLSFVPLSRLPSSLVMNGEEPPANAYQGRGNLRKELNTDLVLRPIYVVFTACRVLF